MQERLAPPPTAGAGMAACCVEKGFQVSGPESPGVFESNNWFSLNSKNPSLKESKTYNKTIFKRPLLCPQNIGGHLKTHVNSEVCWFYADR
jgi:hypothetical protein